MAILTAAEIAAIIARGERVFDNRYTATEHDIDKSSEVPGSDPTIPPPLPTLNADGNAIAIRGKGITTNNPANGDYLRYDSTSQLWVYDAGSGGGGGGGTITVRAVDGTPTNSTATLQFEETSGFTLATSLNTTTIDVANIPVAKLASLTASRAVVTDISGKLAVTSTPAAKLAFLDNVTSDIQAQINALSGGGSGITALTGDVTASGTGSVAATLASVGTAGTYTKVTTDAKGRVTSGTALVSGDLPSHTHAFASQVTGVSISSPTNGQFLQFNGTNWVNATVSLGGNSSRFSFIVNFDGSGNPSSTSSLPSGWSTTISGTEVTVTHNMSMPPCSIIYFGLNTDTGSVWQMRLPTALNQVSYDNATMNTQFKLVINATVAGASNSSSAKVNILC